MLDIGWSEFFLVLVLGIVLMGPKDIPHVIYQAGRMVRRLQYMKFALTQQFENFMEQSDLQELRKGGRLAEHLGVGDVRNAMTMPAQNRGPQDIIEEDEEDIIAAQEEINRDEPSPESASHAGQD